MLPHEVFKFCKVGNTFAHSSSEALLTQPRIGENRVSSLAVREICTKIVFQATVFKKYNGSLLGRHAIENT